MIKDSNELKHNLEQHGYFADESLLTSIYLATKLGRPLFLEGEPGVGKTEVAKLLAKIYDIRFIRVQCYTGLESSEVLYEWNYLKQILSIRLQSEQRKLSGSTEIYEESDLFTKEFLVYRPLLAAISEDKPAVLLIDEVDRADERFEAFLLEYLSEFQITIPELGTIKAKRRPIIFLTSNRTREVHDALRRRCLYQWIDYPQLDKEIEIVKAKSPDLSLELVKQLCAFVATARTYPLEKKPGLAETLEWAETLIEMNIEDLRDEKLKYTFPTIFKTKEDTELAISSFPEMYTDVKALLSRLD